MNFKEKPLDIVLLSTADWSNPFWTNKQHVAVELARRGHRVLYIDSLGLRRPSASAQDLKRIMARLKKGLRAPVQVKSNLWVWSPITIPFQSSPLVQRLNRLVLNAGLRWHLWRLGMKPELLWTYNPMTTTVLDLDKFDGVVYHCVDEIKAQPGMPINEIERAETQLTQQAGLVFVTAEALLETRKTLNPKTFYFSNVADFEHFSAGRAESTVVPLEVAKLPQPVIGFIGAISGYKLDFPLIRDMATRHPEWSIVLIGKVGEGDPWTDLAGLDELKNVHFLGPRPYATLPAYLKGFTVAILPSLLNEYTRSMFPMKFYEYMAAGKPVVATDLHALQSQKGVAYIATSPEDFIVGLEKAVNAPNEGLAARLDSAREMTYEVRTEKMLKLVCDHLQM
jgi:glycosyltransferase involved in cell wall biosynthesis